MLEYNQGLYPLVNIAGQSDTSFLSPNFLHFVQCTGKLWLHVNEGFSQDEWRFNFFLHGSDNELWDDGGKGTILPQIFLYDYVNRGHVCPWLVESDLKKRWLCQAGGFRGLSLFLFVLQAANLNLSARLF